MRKRDRCVGGSSRALSMLLGVLVAFGGAVAAGAAPLLYTVQEFDPLLQVIDASDASNVGAAQTITLAGHTVYGASGLAREPGTGTLYALLVVSTDATPAVELVTLDPGSGVATSVGNTGDYFTGLSFDAGGALYAVTHEGYDASPSASAEQLHSLSLSDGSSTLLAPLGNGGFGEALGYDPSSDRLYHASGEDFDDPIFESIDPANPGAAPSGVALSGDPFDGILALGSDGAGGLYMADFLNNALYSIALSGGSGTVSEIGAFDFDVSNVRGLVLVPEPSSAALVSLGLAALGVRRRARR